MALKPKKALSKAGKKLSKLKKSDKKSDKKDDKAAKKRSAASKKGWETRRKNAGKKASALNRRLRSDPKFRKKMEAKSGKKNQKGKTHPQEG